MNKKHHTSSSEWIRISPESPTPKYKQVIDSICHAVKTGRAKKGDLLPSINQLANQHQLARDTIVKAYDSLKSAGIIGSAHGKGFHIATDHYVDSPRVFVLFDTFTPYKEILYSSMHKAVTDQAVLDIYFHHFNPEVFIKLISDARGKYSKYIIMAFPHPKVIDFLEHFSKEEHLLLDIEVEYRHKRCPQILQNHDKEMESALVEALDRIQTYREFVMIFPEDKGHPKVKKGAFHRFCETHGISGRIESSLAINKLSEGQAYFLLEDLDMIHLIKECQNKKLRIGHQVGILSYNDTPMKEFIANGISVISIDFEDMGKTAAQYILNPEPSLQATLKTHFIRRGSL